MIRHSHEICSGDPAYLGATVHRDGVNFALFSQNAEQVELCLFTEDGLQETRRYFLPECHDGIWHGFVPGLKPPFAYGYRVHGRYRAEMGLRFNANKLLVDPYAKRLVGEFQWCDAVFGYDKAQPDHPSKLDSAPYVPKALVIDESVIAPRPVKKRIQWPQTVVYETHVRGMTMLHPAVNAAHRGTFLGMADSSVTGYLQKLGVDAIELMPVQSMVDEQHLHQKGLVNFWGYNALNFFAFNSRYAVGDPVAEFVAMVNTLHESGLEVILDVVFNHTCESDEHGPTVSYRGIDNCNYYQLETSDRSKYLNATGCGNTLNMQNPAVVRLVVDNLRYLVSLGVDGFRFDLGSCLGRSGHWISPDAPMWQAILNDPVLKTRKFTAEPWDIGPNGYQLGHLPKPISEWNDRYRDSVRRVWRGDHYEFPEFARRLHGSADVFERHGRPPHCSLNFVAAHDGASLADLVMYTGKHNLANGEDNRDGHGDNVSQNFGIEGESLDPEVLRKRAVTLRNLLTTLFVSQGTPMLCAGDEWGHTRKGNNNVYCQDNDHNWLNWEEAAADRFKLLALVRTLIAMRNALPALHADEYRHDDDPSAGCTLWFGADGHVLTAAEWESGDLRTVGHVVTVENEAVLQGFLAIFHIDDSDVHCDLPCQNGYHWHAVIDTARDCCCADARAAKHTTLHGASVQIFVSDEDLAQSLRALLKEGFAIQGTDGGA